METIKKKCPYCGKEIDATSEEQAKANLSSHIVFKHGDKIQYEDVMEEFGINKVTDDISKSHKKLDQDKFIDI